MNRIKGEYNEMPGLSLTAPQARRLWNLDEQSCDRALERLLDEQFLLRTGSGAFVRNDPSSPGPAVLRRRG